MKISMYDVITFLSLLVLLIALACARLHSVQTESAYLFAGRKTGCVPLIATLVMTEFNSGTLISFSALGFFAGYWALTLPLIFLIGLLFYAVTVARKWKEYDGTSCAGFFTQRYGETMGRGVSALLLIAMTGFSATYIRSLMLIFTPLFPETHPWLLSALLTMLVLSLCLRGGLHAIIRTDLICFFLVLLFFPSLPLLFIHGTATAPPIPGTAILSPRFVISLIVLTMFTYILAPWYGQKIFAARSSKVAIVSVIIAAIIVSLLYGSAILATALFRAQGGELTNPELALPTIVHLLLPQGVRGFGYALLFATSATTLTGVWSAMSTLCIGDFMKQKDASYSRALVITLLFAVLSCLLSNTLVDQVFEKMILANIPIAALSFALLGGFYWKKTTTLGAFVSILIGCSSSLSFYFWFGEEGCYTWYWAIFSIPLVFLSGIITSLLCRKRKEVV